MDRLERFDYLMEIFDRWTKNASDRPGAPFKYLREEAQIREIVVVPGFRGGAPTLKKFFAMEILEIYPWKNTSNVTLGDIRGCLAEKSARRKKYNFYFDELDKCFSPEENRKAANKNPLLVKSAELIENTKDWGEIPCYLLEKLQKAFQKKLGEYWRMCGKEGEDKEALERKRDKYKETLFTLALHEIFVRECSGRWFSLIEEYEQRGAVLKKITGDMTELGDLLDTADEAEKGNLLEEIKNRAQEGTKNVRWVGRFMVLQWLCMEHIISIEAEVQLIMILEMKLLEEIREDKGTDPKYRVERKLRFLDDRCLAGLEKYNRNRQKYYLQLESRVREIFVHFMDKCPWNAQKNFSDAVETYLRIVEQGVPNDSGRRELWDAQCIMAVPVVAGRTDRRES